MFQLGWVELCWPTAAIAAGTDVAVLVRVWGAWSLPDHVESGGERFSIEWDEFSRPRHPLARLGYPLTRRLQQRFARDSMAAMRRASQ